MKDLQRVAGPERALQAYFGKYLPEEPAPSLDDFRNVDTFGMFDTAIASLRPRPRGAKRKAFVQETADCLAGVLVHAFGGALVESGVGPGVAFPSGPRVGDGSICHHLEWIEKCLANPVADSIRIKCAVMFSPRERPIEDAGLADPQRLAHLCTAIGRPPTAELLHRVAVASLALLASDPSLELLSPDERETLTPFERAALSARRLQQRLSDLWAGVPRSEKADALAAIFLFAKLQDCATFGLLNSRHAMQMLPGEIAEDLLGASAKGWPFEHLTLGLRYLQDTPVGPNGKLLETIWNLWKQASPPTNAELTEALALVLALIGKKGFHHDIADFKRVLRLVPVECADLVVHFEPSVRQGCYAAVAALFNEWPSLPFAVKVDLVHLLDTARGTTPKPAWLAKLAAMAASDQWPDVVRFARWIEDHAELAYPPSVEGWADEVFKRFSKAARWILASPTRVP